MKYFYEYKIKNGAKVEGHNLKDIMITDKGIFLSGFDIINASYGNEYNYWRTLLKHNEIEYIKIEPMEEEHE